MKKKYVKVMWLSMALLTIGIPSANQLFAQDNKEEKEEKTAANNADANLPTLTINGTGSSATFTIDPTSLTGEEITLKATPGLTVTPTTLPANKGKQKVTVSLSSSKTFTEGKIILRDGDTRSYVKVLGYGTALPVKEIAKSPAYKGGESGTNKFEKTFKPGKNGYTIEFRVKTDESEKEFFPYFVNEKGHGFKAYITSSEIGLFNAYKKGIANPATKGRKGGKGRFYNNDGAYHTYRIAVTPDERAFIYRDGMPIDTVRVADFAPQPYFSDRNGEAVENLLKNGNFEGEFDADGESKLATRIEGWDIVIGDRWNSEQFIKPVEIDNDLDVDNHVFEIKPYKWAGGWSDGILMQVVDVVPGETYTLSALAKGGIAKKAGTLTGKIIIDEAQDNSLRSVTEIASDEWELYSMDYTPSADCKQLRIAFTVGRGKWGGDIGAVQVDNAQLTGVQRRYTPKFGFEESTADIEYMTIDESGAYAPAQPTIAIELDK